MTIFASCAAATAMCVAAAPPMYTATVLPQLDTTNDPNALTFTTPNAIGDSGFVTGVLGSGQGFIWSRGEGELLVPQFPEAADEAWGNGVNAAGDVVGALVPVGGFFTRPFHLAADGTFTQLPTLDDDLQGGASDINDAGMIVGSSERASGGTFGGPTTAVYWLDGELREIGHLGGPVGGASAVNNNNVVVGSSNTGFGQPLQPFRWTEAGGIEVLPQLVDGVPATPADINDNGIIVGRGGLSLFANEAVYWDAEGEIHPLPRIHDDAMDVGVLAVNNAGVMVGHELSAAAFVPEARLWLDDQVYHLADLVTDLPDDVELRQATGVNDDGVIAVEVATQVNGAIQFLTVLLTPVAGEPECPADVNIDGAVDVTDLLDVLAAWGACEGCKADITGDGMVDVSDLLELLSAWGACE